MKRSAVGTVAVLGVFSVGAASLGLLPGCAAGYSSYPVVEGADLANKSPDGWPTFQLAGMAARYVADRYPPNAPSWASGEPVTPPERFVVNIPSGMSRIPYERAIGFAGAGAEAPSAENSGLPVYHVTRVWVRGHLARADVMRPVGEVGENPGGGAVYQTITVYFEGGFRPWKITGRQVRDALTPSVPELAFLPAPKGQEPSYPAPIESAAEGAEGGTMAVLRPKRRPITLAAGDGMGASVFAERVYLSGDEPRLAGAPLPND